MFEKNRYFLTIIFSNMAQTLETPRGTSSGAWARQRLSYIVIDYSLL